MANELQAQYVSGKTVYAIVLSSTGQTWNGTAFEAPLAANWLTYKLVATEASTTGLYEATMPAGISSAGSFSVLFYLQAGGGPSSTDLVIGKGSIEWSGSAEIPLASLPANVWAYATRTLSAFSFTVTASIPSAPGWYTTPPTTAQIATAVLTDTTASDLSQGGSLGAAIGSISTILTTQTAWAKLATSGSVNDTAPTTTMFKGNAGLSSTDGFYVSATPLLVCFTSGPNAGLKVPILGYVGATRQITLGAGLLAPPNNNDQFDII